MGGSLSIAEDFDRLKACVLIPTYNNAATLGKVITDVLQFTRNIIVINDGSTDDTLQVIQAFPGLLHISYKMNRGKGWALRQGFQVALANGYEFAITIDSDGQHFANDLPRFLEGLRPGQASLVVGARNMDQDSVPRGSSFGNRFSNFWFHAETGIRLPDTQSGYRLYPVAALQNMTFFTKKYEFEIEVLVRAAWNDIAISPVPVTVYYPPKAERVSHFRPKIDFFRISILNTLLVLIAFLYIKPRNLLRSIFVKKNFRQILSEQLFHPHHSDGLKAFSVAFGIFMGIIPLWGFQLVIAIFLAVVFKLNKALVIIAANISIPPMIPLILFASYKTGALWLGSKATDLAFSHAFSLTSVARNLRQYIYGSITLALVAGLMAGLITFFLLKLFNRKPILAG